MADESTTALEPDRLSRAARDAAQRWLALGAGGRRKCVLPPWDENIWFALPTFTPVAVPASINGGTAQLCTANPMRVGLLISTIFALLHIAPSSSIDITGPFGMPLDRAIAPYFLTQAEFGPLVTMEWWVAQQGATQAAKSVAVIEIVLKDWPRQPR